MAHTSRGKDFVEYDTPYNVGMSGIIGQASGYHAILDCDVLLLLGCDFAWQSDRRWQPAGHCTVQETGKGPARASCIHMAQRPNGSSAVIGGE
jgi:thiamine pyrophosphate-dependent acetolactate synthase large subunit-like protein